MSQVSIIFLVSGTWKFLHVWLRVSAWDEECAELGDAIVSAQNSIKATSKPLGARPVWDLKLQLRCFGGSRGSKIGSMTEEERSILGGKKKTTMGFMQQAEVSWEPPGRRCTSFEGHGNGADRPKRPQSWQISRFQDPGNRKSQSRSCHNFDTVILVLIPPCHMVAIFEWQKFALP